MIQIVMKPEKAPVVNHEGLYSVRLNGEHLMYVRAKNALHAEKKLIYCFKRELTGKTLSFNLEAFTEGGILEDEANEHNGNETGAGDQVGGPAHPE